MDKSTKKRATITQVAKHAGVSVGTVSNYLNGTAGVSHDRAARIQQAIDVLDYIPDTLASSLRRKDSTAIHVLTPHLDSAFYTNTIHINLRCKIVHHLLFFRCQESLEEAQLDLDRLKNEASSLNEQCEIRIQNKEENKICRQFGAIDGMETE